MPINFVQLLQNSWNFMRNQRQFVLTSIILLAALQIVNTALFPPLPLSAPSSEGLEDPKIIQATLQGQFLPILITNIISVYINVWIVLNIKAINNGNRTHFSQLLGTAAQHLLPAVCLTIFMLMPLSIATLFGLVSLSSRNPIFTISLTIAALFLFSKMCLVVYVYLLEEPQKKIGESIAFSWTMSRGKMRFLIPFIVLVYCVPSMLNLIFTYTVGGEIGLFLSHTVMPILNLFLMIFSFRFYQALRALPH